MTPEEQQKIQTELTALRAMNQERINTRRDVLFLQTGLNDIGYKLSEGDKAIYAQLAAEKQQQIKDIVAKWQQAPYNIAPGRDSIYQAIRAREDALGLPHMPRQEPQPHPTMSPDWKQSADQRAGQSPTAQELIKNMTTCRDAYGLAQDILDTGKTVRLSELAQKYLAEQQRVAQEGFDSNRRAYEARYGALPPGSIPKYIHLQEQHTPQELEQMAHEINTKAFMSLYEEKASERQALHPDIQRTRDQDRGGLTR